MFKKAKGAFHEDSLLTGNSIEYKSDVPLQSTLPSMFVKIQYTYTLQFNGCDNVMPQSTLLYSLSNYCYQLYRELILFLNDYL